MSAPLTPEELADQYADKIANKRMSRILLRMGFLAGYTKQTEEKDEQIKQLTAWKESATAQFAPLLDYCKSRESDIPLGVSVIRFAINALKSQKEKDARIAELEKELRKYKNQEETYDYACKKADRLAEENYGYKQELEALRLERDQLKAAYIKYRMFINSIKNLYYQQQVSADGVTPEQVIDETAAAGIRQIFFNAGEII